MKFDSKILGIFGLFLVLFISGCGSQRSGLNVSLSTNEYIYHSADEMRLNTTIFCSMCPEHPENVAITVRGILDRRGNYRIKEDRQVILNSEKNNEEFVFLMPRCYGCAGVSPGKYNIRVDIIKNKTKIWNGSVEIYLETNRN